MNTREQDLQFAESITQTACLACEHEAALQPTITDETAKVCFRLLFTMRLLDTIPDLAAYIAKQSPEDLVQIRKDLEGLAEEMMKWTNPRSSS